MYQIINKIITTSGKRDDVARLLQESAQDMPGCRMYLVSLDLDNEETIWINEVWESQEDHAASLELETVKEAIRKARPFIKAANRIAHSKLSAIMV